MHVFIDANIFVGFFEIAADSLSEIEKLIAVIQTGEATLWPAVPHFESVQIVDSSDKRCLCQTIGILWACLYWVHGLQHRGEVIAALENQMEGTRIEAQIHMQPRRLEIE